MQSPPSQQPKSPKISWGSSQYPGTRDNQEDYAKLVTLAPQCILGIMADGMGGHEQGELASMQACEQFSKTYPQRRDLGDAIQAANSRLAQLKQRGHLAKDAGCTLIAVSIQRGRLAWCSIGDSYIYLVRQGQAYRINTLHTWGDILDARASMGIISKREAQSFSNRKALYSALTGTEFKEDGVEVRLDKTPLKLGDRLILCSDGIDTLGNDAKLRQLFTKRSFQQLSAPRACERLIEQVRACNARNQDNTTALVIDYGHHSASHQQPIPSTSTSTSPKTKKALIISTLAALPILAAAGLFLQQQDPRQTDSGGGSSSLASSSGGGGGSVFPPPVNITTANYNSTGHRPVTDTANLTEFLELLTTPNPTILPINERLEKHPDYLKYIFNSEISISKGKLKNQLNDNDRISILKNLLGNSKVQNKIYDTIRKLNIDNQIIWGTIKDYNDEAKVIGLIQQFPQSIAQCKSAKEVLKLLMIDQSDGQTVKLIINNASSKSLNQAIAGINLEQYQNLKNKLQGEKDCLSKIINQLNKKVLQDLILDTNSELIPLLKSKPINICAAINELSDKQIKDFITRLDINNNLQNISSLLIDKSRDAQLSTIGSMILDKLKKSNIESYISLVSLIGSNSIKKAKILEIKDNITFKILEENQDLTNTLATLTKELGDKWIDKYISMMHKQYKGKDPCSTAINSFNIALINNLLKNLKNSNNNQKIKNQIATLTLSTEDFRKLEQAYLDYVTSDIDIHGEHAAKKPFDKNEVTINSLLKETKNSLDARSLISASADRLYAYSLISSALIIQENSDIDKQISELFKLWNKTEYPIPGYLYICRYTIKLAPVFKKS